MAGQLPALGRDDGKAVLFKRADVVLGDGVFQHTGVHGGRHQFRAPRRQHGGGEHIVGDAVSHLGDDVGGGRGHQDDVRLFGQLDVGHFKLEIPVEGVHHALVAGQRLKGDGRDELGGVAGHDDLDVGPPFFQRAGHPGHFISGDAAGHAQQDAFAFQLHIHTRNLPVSV